MSLDKLSNELLIEIATWVGVTATKQSLLNLALCSHHLNTIATPMIYSSFDNEDSGALSSFLRTLLARPDLGLRIESFSTTMVQGKSRRPLARYTSEDLARVRSAIDRISALKPLNGASQIWMQRILKGKWHALRALTLFHLPSLRELRLYGYKIEHPFQRYLAQESLHTMPAALDFIGNSEDYLPFLESVEIQAFDPMQGLNYPSILPFFKIKSVKAVSINGVLGADFDDQFQSFNTDEIAFTESCCSGESMVRFLRCFPNLKSFLYNHDAPTGYEAFEFDAARFGQAIVHLKPCLEFLHINNDAHGDDFDEGQFGVIGSLHDFISLEILEIDADGLLGADHGRPRLPGEPAPSYGHASRKTLLRLLPPSLQYLGLTKCSISILEQLWDLINWKKRTGASLKSVSVRWKGSLELAAMGFEARHSRDQLNLIKASCEAGIHMNLEPIVLGLTYNR